jgi:hypothetical protein
MTYVDTSLVLAEVLAESMRPPSAFWITSDLTSSRLTEYEAWVRLHAYGKAGTHGRALALVLERLHLVELTDEACRRARTPFPLPVRTLDALHLSCADFLRTQGFVVDVATLDTRMASIALAMGFRLTPVPSI